MSTLAEIEAATELLSLEEQTQLLEHLSRRLQRKRSGTAETDPVAALIGAFNGRFEATGRNAEEILYGAGKAG